MYFSLRRSAILSCAISLFDFIIISALPFAFSPVYTPPFVCTGVHVLACTLSVMRSKKEKKKKGKKGEEKKHDCSPAARSLFLLLLYLHLRRLLCRLLCLLLYLLLYLSLSLLCTKQIKRLTPVECTRIYLTSPANPIATHSSTLMPTVWRENRNAIKDTVPVCGTICYCQDSSAKPSEQHAGGCAIHPAEDSTGSRCRTGNGECIGRSSSSVWGWGVCCCRGQRVHISVS